MLVRTTGRTFTFKLHLCYYLHERDSEVAAERIVKFCIYRIVCVPCLISLLLWVRLLMLPQINLLKSRVHFQPWSFHRVKQILSNLEFRWHSSFVHFSHALSRQVLDHNILWDQGPKFSLSLSLSELAVFTSCDSFHSKTIRSLIIQLML